MGLIAVLAVVAVIVLSFILYNEWPLMTGKKIVLATRPVDPFDPLRGQYMTINYEISRINTAENFGLNDRVYVSLKEDAEHVWRMEKASSSMPKEGDFIKGVVKDTGGESIVVEYGVEQFFFERNAEIPTRNITVELRVADSGRAKIYQLLYNGKPVDIKYQEFSIQD